jgi:hypothetical protein
LGLHIAGHGFSAVSDAFRHTEVNEGTVIAFPFFIFRGRRFFRLLKNSDPVDESGGSFSEFFGHRRVGSAVFLKVVKLSLFDADSEHFFEAENLSAQLHEVYIVSFFASPFKFDGYNLFDIAVFAIPNFHEVAFSG